MVAMGMPLPPGNRPLKEDRGTAFLLNDPDPVMQAMLGAAASIRARKEQSGGTVGLSVEGENAVILGAADRAAGMRTGAG